MNLTFFLIFAILTVIPGILLIFGANRFKKNIQHPSAILILIGAAFILIHLIISAGTYYHSFLGDAQSLADYSLTKSWVSPLAEYVGLVLVAAGLLIFKKKQGV